MGTDGDLKTMGRPVIRRILFDYLLMTLGGMIMALALIWFLDPYKVSAGGVSGLAIAFGHLTGLPLGVLMLIMNVPLFIIGVRMLGRRFGIRTLYGFMIFSVMVDLIDRVLYDRVLDTSSYLLSDP